jgi:prophage regulatory protein
MGGSKHSKIEVITRKPAAGLPETGFLRLPQIIGDNKVQPPVPAVVPVCKSTWWAGVKSGRFPAPVKLGPRTTAWRVEDIRALLESGVIFEATGDSAGVNVCETPPSMLASMTLRDYFAAKALQGAIAGAMADGSRLGKESPREFALTAYIIADAMLAARGAE